MTNLKAIRKRIQGIRSTQQLTKAMKLVAAAKLQKAQTAVVSLRPYADGIKRTIYQVLVRLEHTTHPLLNVRKAKNVRLLVFSSDRGLCGSFNLNVERGLTQFMEVRAGEYESVSISVIGNKIKDFVDRMGWRQAKSYDDVWKNPSYSIACTVGNELATAFISGEFDRLILVYNYFVSPLVHKIVWEQVLPVEPPKEELPESQFEHIFEPSKTQLLDTLVSLYLNVRVYKAMLESFAAEMGARMTAMDQATKNAQDLIERLTLQYNKARQEAITKELMDIVGGSEAIREA